MKPGDRILLLQSCDERVLPLDGCYTVKWVSGRCVCFEGANGRVAITTKNRVSLLPKFRGVGGHYTETEVPG